jgi:hypothetical protein
VASLVFVRMKEHSEMIGKWRETRVRKKGESCNREDDTRGETAINAIHISTDQVERLQKLSGKLCPARHATHSNSQS